MNIGRPNQNSQEPSYIDSCKKYWSSIPLFTFTVLILSIGFYILSWVNENYLGWLINSLPLISERYQVWGVLTSFLVNISIINLLFSFFSWIFDAIRLERENGTVKYLLTFFINNTFIQITYLCLNWGLSQAFPSLFKIPSMGLWPYIISEITIMCLSDPTRDLMLFLIPCPIKAVFYPYILCAFFTLLNGRIGVDIIAGLLYGHIYVWLLKSIFTLSDSFCARLETNCLFSCLTNIAG